MKEQLKILTCGSVDDGKSTLIGHLLYDSKLLYTDQVKTLEMESKVKNNGNIDYSLLLDGLDEEREQGITIDVSYRYFNTDKRSFIVLDTPGHEEYTRNMAVGASNADLAILLIDATKGVLIQTKRHIKICAMMGIRDYVVAINKMDLINYDKETYYNLSEEIKKCFENIEYSSLKIIPVSATEGDNISENSNNMEWYNGESLIQYLEEIEVAKEKSDKFILPVQRVCRPNQDFRGFQGTVASGNISVNDEIVCLPSREKAKIRELFKLDTKVLKANYGEAITVTLDKEIDVSRGCILTNDDKISITNNIKVTMLWMEEEELKLNTAYYISIGTVNTLCYIRKINYKVDIDNDDRIANNVVKKNEIVNCNIEVLEKIAVSEFRYNRTLGSLILINRITNATSSCAIIEKVLENENLFYYNTTITKEERKKHLYQNPITIWFTGLPSSGKSSIADELERILSLNGYNTMLLDGDNVRLGLNKDLSFTEKDRIENIRRISEVAKLMNDAGLICITSFITPLEINRAMAKSIVGNDLVLVYIDSSVEECESRDKKGLYKKAKNGEIKDFTGVNSPYEIPENPDLIVHNDDCKSCAKEIYEYILERIKLCK